MPRGRFIALEGGEGSGKSTQARMLAEALADRGVAVELTREPGGTPGAEAVRALLLDPPGEGWGPRAEALLFAAARSDHVEKRIVPALAAGRWIISDRFLDSSRAYQGGAGGVGDPAVLALHEIGSGGLRPDLTVLFTAAPEVLAERIAQRDGASADAIGGRSETYHSAVGETFAGLAAADPQGFSVVDGHGSPEEVHARVLRAIAPLLERAR